MRHTFLTLAFLAGLSTLTSAPVFAGSFTSTYLCYGAPYTTSDTIELDPAATADCSGAIGSQTVNQTTPNPNGGADQVFNATATAFASPDTWKVGVDMTLTNYQRSMYVWSSTSDEAQVIPTPGFAEAGFSDELTVNSAGGPGVYSLNYIFSLDGTLDSTDRSLFEPSFCAILSLPQGTGTQTSTCISALGTAPSTFTLTYADLPFGGPIDPTVTIFAEGVVEPLDHGQEGTAADTIISGSLHSDFGDTVTLSSLLVTDANGNPIPGITIDSQSGFDYPVAPGNLATPEPAGLAIAGLGFLAAVGFLRRKRNASAQ